MAKSSKADIAKDEQKILDFLFSDAHSSLDVIAKKCGFSSQKVWRVIKNLETRGTIWGYSTISDDKDTDKTHFIILFKRTSKPVDEKIISAFLKTPIETSLPEKIQLETIEYTHGSYDGFMTFYADSLRTAKKFVEAMMQRFQGYFSDMHLLETLVVFQRSGVANPHVLKDIKLL
jgi:DNA-binding Lrp family transcriptional regulator